MKQKIYGKYYGGSEIADPNQEAMFLVPYKCKRCDHSGQSMMGEYDDWAECNSCDNVVALATDFELIMPNETPIESNKKQFEKDMAFERSLERENDLSI